MVGGLWVNFRGQSMSACFLSNLLHGLDLFKQMHFVEKQAWILYNAYHTNISQEQPNKENNTFPLFAFAF